VTTSSSESYSYLFKLLADPGDVVLVPEPSYPLFDSLARLEALETVPYRLEQVGHGRWRIDLDSVDDALARVGDRIRALIVVTPNHPTGSVLVSDQLDALDARCAQAGIALIADEVFADFISQPRAEHVRCVASTTTRSLTFSLGGLSKSCGLPQLKLGWIALGGPQELWTEARRRLEWIADTFLPVGAPIEVALAAVLTIGTRRRAAIIARLDRNRQALATGLTTCFGTASPITVLPSEGGWVAILRLPALFDDESWALDLLEHAGVLVQPGYFYDLQGTHIVVSLLPEPESFAAGIELLAARVRSLNGTDLPALIAPPASL
jgi:alanine-synthesizing transaminase